MSDSLNYSEPKTLERVTLPFCIFCKSSDNLKMSSEGYICDSCRSDSCER